MTATGQYLIRGCSARYLETSLKFERDLRTYEFDRGWNPAALDLLYAPFVHILFGKNHDATLCLSEQQKKHI